MPGHTMFALGLAGTLDGVRVAYTGDNLLAGALSPLRASARIYRNVVRLDSIRVGVERLLAHEPELLLTGHTGALEISRADLDDFVAWARELELVVRRLVLVPGLEDEALDPYVARVDPYRATVVAGDAVAIDVIVTNHGPVPREAVVRLGLTDGWRAEPAQAAVEVAAGGATATLPFTIFVPSTARPGRHVPTVDLTLGGEPRGELAELLLEVLPP
jgi:glyoxylase-like metal-dependent hydrolase (beta-lactamase superfamily II)